MKTITVMRRKTGALVAGFLLALTAMVGLSTAGPAPAATAASGIDMNLACQYTTGYTSYRGQLLYPSQGALGWRCVDRAGVRPTVGVDLWGYCVNVLGYNGAYTNNTSDPYSWYCA